MRLRWPKIKCDSINSKIQPLSYGFGLFQLSISIWNFQIAKLPTISYKFFFSNLGSTFGIRLFLRFLSYRHIISNVDAQFVSEKEISIKPSLLPNKKKTLWMQLTFAFNSLHRANFNFCKIPLILFHMCIFFYKKKSYSRLFSFVWVFLYWLSWVCRCLIMRYFHVNCFNKINGLVWFDFILLKKTKKKFT